MSNERVSQTITKCRLERDLHGFNEVNQFKQKQRCGKCSEDDHDTSECMSKEMRCANREGNHPTWQFECTTWEEVSRKMKNIRRSQHISHNDNKQRETINMEHHYNPTMQSKQKPSNNWQHPQWPKFHEIHNVIIIKAILLEIHEIIIHTSLMDSHRNYHHYK